MSTNSPGDLNAEFQQIIAYYHQSEQARLEQAKAKLRTEILPALVQHVMEDLGRIPTVQDWLGKIQPESWMLGRYRGGQV